MRFISPTDIAVISSRSHQSLIALPAKLFYKDELVPCAESELVNNCLGFRGLTEASRGKTPFLFHGIIGQVGELSLSLLSN